MAKLCFQFVFVIHFFFIISHAVIIQPAHKNGALVFWNRTRPWLLSLQPDGYRLYFNRTIANTTTPYFAAQVYTRNVNTTTSLTVTHVGHSESANTIIYFERGKLRYRAIHKDQWSYHDEPNDAEEWNLTDYSPLAYSNVYDILIAYHQNSLRIYSLPHQPSLCSKELVFLNSSTSNACLSSSSHRPSAIQMSNFGDQLVLAYNSLICFYRFGNRLELITSLNVSNMSVTSIQSEWMDTTYYLIGRGRHDNTTNWMLRTVHITPNGVINWNKELVVTNYYAEEKVQLKMTLIGRRQLATCLSFGDPQFRPESFGFLEINLWARNTTTTTFPVNPLPDSSICTSTIELVGIVPQRRRLRIEYLCQKHPALCDRLDGNKFSLVEGECTQAIRERYENVNYQSAGDHATLGQSIFKYILEFSFLLLIGMLSFILIEIYSRKRSVANK